MALSCLKNRGRTRGGKKESITQQYTAGTFGRPLSSYDRYFSNVPYFLNRDARKSSNMANFGRFLWREIGGTFAENVPFFDRFVFCMEENIGQRILSKDLENIVKNVASGKTLTSAERSLVEKAYGTSGDVKFAKTIVELSEILGVSRQNLLGLIYTVTEIPIEVLREIVEALINKKPIPERYPTYAKINSYKHNPNKPQGINGVKRRLGDF